MKGIVYDMPAIHAAMKGDLKQQPKPPEPAAPKCHKCEGEGWIHYEHALACRCDCNPPDPGPVCTRCNGLGWNHHPGGLTLHCSKCGNPKGLSPP